MKTNFAKTKILVTLGPSTDKPDIFEKILEAGVDAIRLNFSHGNFEYFENLFRMIKKFNSKRENVITTLVDLQGPKIRIGDIENGKFEIKKGEILEISTNDFLGSNNRVSTSYKLLTKDAKPGDTILIDDGLLRFTIDSIKGSSCFCLTENGGELKSRKGMNMPGMVLSTSALTEKDKANIDFALQFDIDYIALSFVRNAGDILDLRNHLKSKGFTKQIIAKIEKPEAVNNFDDILAVSDGIMVARGDLGVEMREHDVPVIQKKIIKKCNSIGKPVITATQMLESMIHNPVPTRAEASDVANAVWDGTDVVMLSGETSVGKFPIETVRVMNNILLSAESEQIFSAKVEFNHPDSFMDNLFDAAGRGVVDIANQIGTSIIAVFTKQGRGAKLISKYKPLALIAAFSKDINVLKMLNLYRGVIPFYIDCFDDEQKAVDEAILKLRKTKLITNEEIVLFTAGSPVPDGGNRNWFRFHKVKKA